MRCMGPDQARERRCVCLDSCKMEAVAFDCKPGSPGSVFGVCFGQRWAHNFDGSRGPPGPELSWYCKLTLCHEEQADGPLESHPDHTLYGQLVLRGLMMAKPPQCTFACSCQGCPAQEPCAAWSLISASNLLSCMDCILRAREIARLPVPAACITHGGASNAFVLPAPLALLKSLMRG